MEANNDDDLEDEGENSDDEDDDSEPVSKKKVCTITGLGTVVKLMNASRKGGHLVLRSPAQGCLSELPGTFLLLWPPQLQHHGPTPYLAHLRQPQTR